MFKVRFIRFIDTFLLFYAFGGSQSWADVIG